LGGKVASNDLVSEKGPEGSEKKLAVFGQKGREQK